MQQAILVMSPSIDAWAVRAAPGPIEKGDFVLFMLSHPLAGPEPVKVTKRALCMPGERISLIVKPSTMEPHAMDGWYYCDGVLLGVTKPYRSEEHTSELQSLMRHSYAVFCLKKKINSHKVTTNTQH